MLVNCVGTRSYSTSRYPQSDDDKCERNQFAQKKMRALQKRCVVVCKFCLLLFAKYVEVLFVNGLAYPSIQ